MGRLRCQPPFAQTTAGQREQATATFFQLMLGGRHLDPRARTGLRAPLLTGPNPQALPGSSANSAAGMTSPYVNPAVSRGQRRGRPPAGAGTA